MIKGTLLENQIVHFQVMTSNCHDVQENEINELGALDLDFTLSSTPPSGAITTHHNGAGNPPKPRNHVVPHQVRLFQPETTAVPGCDHAPSSGLCDHPNQEPEPHAAQGRLQGTGHAYRSLLRGCPEHPTACSPGEARGSGHHRQEGQDQGKDRLRRHRDSRHRAHRVPSSQSGRNCQGSRQKGILSRLLAAFVDGDVTARPNATPDDRDQRRRKGKSRIRDTPRWSSRARRTAGADPVEKQRHRRGGRAPQARGARQLLHERVCQLRVGHVP